MVQTVYGSDGKAYVLLDLCALVIVARLDGHRRHVNPYIGTHGLRRGRPAYSRHQWDAKTGCTSLKQHETSDVIHVVQGERGTRVHLQDDNTELGVSSAKKYYQ